MPRRPRIFEPGGIYHVTAHGIDDRAIFPALRDRQRWIDLLATTRQLFGWNVISFCEMTTHYHVLAQLADPNLSDVMEWLNGKYSRLFNRDHCRRGHLFEKPYEPTHVVSDRHLLAAIAYIALNPVDVNLAARPENWIWSSYGGTIGVRPQWPFVDDNILLSYFGTTRESAVANLRAFVAERAVDRRRDRRAA